MTRLRTSALLAAAAALALTACVAPPPGEPNRTRQGAITGAIAGGLIGAATGEGSRGDEILAGAVIGGATGAGIGQVLDRQAADLRRDLDSRIDVINQGDRLIVRAPQDILFAVNSAALAPTLVSDLRVIGQNLQSYPNSVVQVIGHTDNTGTAAFNQDLSERRAQSVASVLTQSGVSPGRVQVIGRGEAEPIASNASAAGRQQNRRVDIVIVPTGQR